MSEELKTPGDSGSVESHRSRDDLLPCPACGFDATIAFDEKYCCGACSDLRCRMEGPIASNPQDAATKWNRLPRAGQVADAQSDREIMQSLTRIEEMLKPPRRVWPP